jgi:hypothetical protein
MKQKIFEKMHGGYSVHGNCGGGKLKIFLPYVLFII